MNIDSDTPRTDAVAFDLEGNPSEPGLIQTDCPDGRHVETDFARELEREIVQVTKERDEALIRSKAWRNLADTFHKNLDNLDNLEKRVGAAIEYLSENRF